MYTLIYRSKIIVVANNNISLPRYTVFKKEHCSMPIFACDRLVELIMWLILHGHLIKFGHS
ncbi:hypothetical protein Cal7507_0348 [Calothrix sp. PCC 7507]|nr:hypothetical protein Cal7507_0348 [Calothrix sp. PCC 7507]